jgi:hypothetical protein
MAANEHKNLSNANLHNPKDFSTAANDTLLSKDVSGNLSWIAKSIIKTNVIDMQGYTTGNGSTYEYRQLISDGQSPFEMNRDYGNATVGSATFTPSDIFRGAGWIAPDDCTALKLRGWMTTNGGTATLAICKVTPVNNDDSALTPTLLDEVTITGAGNSYLMQVNETTFTSSSISAGDIVFPMLKTGTASKIAYFNVSVEVGYTN